MPARRARFVRASTLALLLILSLATAPATAQRWAEEGASIETLWEGLDAPVNLQFGPDGTLYYIELRGGLRAIPPGADAPDSEPLWTPSNLKTGGERGFVGFALDPDFHETRTFFVYYTREAGGQESNRLSRIVDGEETVLLDAIPSSRIHNSGRIAFMPDGTMLVSVGDAENHAKVRDSEALNGKVLRLNKDGTAAEGNPWGNEAWTKGHRNVYGLAVSPDGVVIGTENGPHDWDEINLLASGLDYGWPTCKGFCKSDGMEDPILAYEKIIAPTGATWYHGHFYFVDFIESRLHRIVPREDGSWADTIAAVIPGRLMDVDVGPDGLYISTWDSIHRVTLDARWHLGHPDGYPLNPPPRGPGNDEGGDGDDDDDQTGSDADGSARSGGDGDETTGRVTPMASFVFLLALASAALLGRRLREDRR